MNEKVAIDIRLTVVGLFGIIGAKADAAPIACCGVTPIWFNPDAIFVPADIACCGVIVGVVVGVIIGCGAGLGGVGF